MDEFNFFFFYYLICNWWDLNPKTLDHSIQLLSTEPLATQLTLWKNYAKIFQVKKTTQSSTIENNEKFLNVEKWCRKTEHRLKTFKKTPSTDSTYKMLTELKHEFYFLFKSTKKTINV